jgi:hypothetical protein
MENLPSAYLDDFLRDIDSWERQRLQELEEVIIQEEVTDSPRSNSQLFRSITEAAQRQFPVVFAECMERAGLDPTPLKISSLHTEPQSWDFFWGWCVTRLHMIDEEDEVMARAKIAVVERETLERLYLISRREERAGPIHMEAEHIRKAIRDWCCGE